MAPALAIRSSDSEPIIPIVGLVIAGVVLLGLSIWFIIVFLRRRRQVSTRVNASGNPPVPGSGHSLHTVDTRETMVGTPEPDYEKSPLPSDLSTPNSSTNFFSRSKLNDGVVLPSRTVKVGLPPRPDAYISREQVVSYHESMGNLPRPFAPFKFPAAPAAKQQSPTRSRFSISAPRHSRGASLAASIRNSIASIAPSFGLVGSQSKVRALFNPLLPDELTVSLGEKLTIVERYEDGWCVVGKTSFGGEVEMGAVPLFCFEKSPIGTKHDRPMRSDSLGVTVTLNGPGFSSRNEVMSWSNF